MRALIVHPEFPVTYWGFQSSMKLAGKKASLPPLGLLSFSALLPDDWDLRLVDLNVDALREEDLEWAELLCVGGMHIQAPSMREVLGRAKAMGLRSVAGGPGPTTADDSEYELADVVLKGEAEGRIDELVAAIEGSGRHILPETEGYPDLSEVPAPRYDLLDLSVYASVGLQYSRGCPFKCEFCDIIEIFGRVPRVKSPEQVMAELDALYRGGYRGSLFFVDDNFIGNAPAVMEMLPRLESWQRARDFPFDLYTEASINLAANEAMLDGMVAAGFTSVFLGIETPSESSLLETGKTQNLRADLTESIEHLTRKGLEVMAGFIVGFDADTAAVFEEQRKFIAGSPIPLSMVGVLTALPGTALWRRLESEGRLRPGGTSGDQFDRPNFETAMDEQTLLEGYSELLSEVYSVDGYYDRCERILELSPPHASRRTLALADVSILVRTILRVGFFSGRSRRCWRLFLKTLRVAPRAFAWAVAEVVKGEHLIRYTSEEVVPRIEAALAQVRKERFSAPAGSRLRVLSTDAPAAIDALPALHEAAR